jgi:hypothetical protein
MNRHFTDAQYYLYRTMTALGRGVRTELRPYEDRVRARLGLEREPDAPVDRVDRIAKRLRTRGKWLARRLQARR